MKCGCECGQTIFDLTDELPHKGHVIPDQEWTGTADAIDDVVILPLVNGTISTGEAFRLVREVLGRRARAIYQCAACGRVYIDDPAGGGVRHCYVPAGEHVSTRVLRSHGEHD
jgi:hypothetical protein